MKKISTLLIFILFVVHTYSQINTDSLLNIINSTESDSVKFENYITLIQQVRFSDLEKSKEYCDEVYSIGKRFNTKHVTAMADYYLAYYYNSKGNYNKAISLYRNVEKYGKTTANLNFEAAALNDIANIYNTEGNTEKALKIFFRVRDLFIEAENIDGLLVVENNIGLLYQKMQDFNKALKYYKIAFYNARKNNSKYNEELLSGNISSIYTSIEKLDSALFYAEHCLSIANELGFERSIGYANQLKSAIKMKEGKFSEGLIFGKAALKSFQKLDDKVLLSELYPILSELYIGTGNLGKAEFYSNLTIENAIDLNYNEGKSKGYFTLSKIYESRNEYKNALESYKEYKIISDTMFDEMKVKALNDIEIKYEVASKDLEIKNQEYQLIQKTSQRNIFMGGGMLLLLMSIFLWYKNSLQKRLSGEKIKNLESERKLLAADFILQGQEEERKRIATDLHDGLGGILATAKLQLQSIHKEIDKLQDLNLMSQAENLIGDAYSEVRRIAHDMMPSSLINLGFKSAIEDLADKLNISSTVNLKTQFYNYTDDIPEKIAVILYRIIQEAINNSLKYADSQNIIIQFSETEDNFLLTIEDDGSGFELKEGIHNVGLGINSIRSRVNYLNGELNMWSKIGVGTGYDIAIPK